MGLYATPHCTPLQRPGPRCSMAGGLCPQAPDSPGQSPPRALSPNGTGSQARLCLGGVFPFSFCKLDCQESQLSPRPPGELFLLWNWGGHGAPDTPKRGQ